MSTTKRFGRFAPDGGRPAPGRWRLVLDPRLDGGSVWFCCGRCGVLSPLGRTAPTLAGVRRVRRRSLLGGSALLCAGSLALRPIRTGLRVVDRDVRETYSDLTHPAPAMPPTDQFVFLVPHQDDETISMGVTIAALAAQGRQVSVVEVTDGNLTRARPQVEARLASSGDHRVVTDADVTASRQAEQRAALARLGIPTDDVQQDWQVRDPAIRVDEPHFQRFLDLMHQTADR